MIIGTNSRKFQHWNSTPKAHSNSSYPIPTWHTASLICQPSYPYCPPRSSTIAAGIATHRRNSVVPSVVTFSERRQHPRRSMYSEYSPARHSPWVVIVRLTAWRLPDTLRRYALDPYWPRHVPRCFCCVCCYYSYSPSHDIVYYLIQSLPTSMMCSLHLDNVYASLNIRHFLLQVVLQWQPSMQRSFVLIESLPRLFERCQLHRWPWLYVGSLFMYVNTQHHHKATI